MCSCILNIPYNRNMTSRFPSLPVLLRTRKLRRVPMVADGNCFYRAVCAGYHKDVELHHLLRRTTMEHMLESLDVYGHYFPSMGAMVGKLNANKRLGVWNSDLADLVPHAVAQMLGCCIEVYSVGEKEEVTRYSFGEGTKVRLLRQDNHYDLLIKN